jgi:hypothetical protein
MGFTTRAAPALFPGFYAKQKASRSIGVILQWQGELLPSRNVVSPARLLLTLGALLPKGVFQPQSALLVFLSALQNGLVNYAIFSGNRTRPFTALNNKDRHLSRSSPSLIHFTASYPISIAGVFILNIMLQFDSLFQLATFKKFRHQNFEHNFVSSILHVQFIAMFFTCLPWQY